MQSGTGNKARLAVQGWWMRVQQDADGPLAARGRGSALPGDAAGRLDRLETAVGRLQTVLEAAARQLEASAAGSQASAIARVGVRGGLRCRILMGSGCSRPDQLTALPSHDAGTKTAGIC